MRGASKSYLKLVGNPGAPEKVVLKGGGGRQNGVLVDGADEVTVRGFKARGYAANGFFFTNVVGYTARDLIAAKTGVYGVYAFNSKGGTMRDSEAYYHSDAGFYIGQTPAQVKPVRSIVTNVESWGNPVGFSGTNMRYVTITGSRFYNNAIGLVPNALDSEKFPPAEDNVIRGNEIFWNNFNFHAGAPFKPKTSGVVPLVPVGTGIAPAGRPAQRDRAEPDLRQLHRRRRDGRGLPARGEPAGAGAGGQLGDRQQLRPRRDRSQRARPGDRRQRQRQLLRRQHRRRLDASGRRLHDRGLPLLGGQRVQQRGPAGARLVPRARPRCRSGSSTRTRRSRASSRWSSTRREPAAGPCPPPSPPSPRCCARRRRARASPSARPSKLFDNYYLPFKLTVNKGSTITWKWPTDVAIDVHDVKLKSGPAGVRRFHSEPASSGYRYRRTLKKPGRYEIVCTLHEEMTMTIRVRR